MPPSAPCLYVAATPHGYGHLSMTAAVLSALQARRPDLRVILETTLPETIIRARVTDSVTVVPETDDFGMAMVSSTALDLEASAARYRALQDDWEATVTRAVRRMENHRPDLVLSNVGYIALAAAKQLGIPSLGLGPFTWADIYRAYLGSRPEAPAILETMDGAYRSAHAMMVAEGAMPMADLPNRRPIGPLGTPGRPAPEALRAALGGGPETRLALVTFGGVASGLELSSWPHNTGWRWLARGGVAANHPDAVNTEALTDWTFQDLLASCDAVITKLGYGTSMECGLTQRPTLYWPRADGWPEEPYLKAWLEQQTPLRAADPHRLRKGDILDDLTALLAQPMPPGPMAQATGAEDATAIILDTLATR